MTGENKGSNSTGGAHPKSAQPRGKRSDGATSSTFIKPPTPPDRAIWGKKIQSKQEEFNDLKKKLEEVMEKLVRTKVVDPEREHFYEQQKKLTQRMQEVQTVIREEREKRSVITKSMRDIRAMREELEHKLHELTGQLGTFKSIDEIEEALNFITLKMETGGSGSLRQEKEYLRRRKLLEAAKEQVAHLKPLRENIEHCSDKELSSLQEAKVLQWRLDELNAELRGVLQEKQSAVVPVSKVREEQAQARKERDEIRACMTRVRAEIDALRSERQAENEAYQKKREEWKLQVEAVKKAAAEERERRLEERKAQAERYERERQEEQAKLRLNPYEKEIDTCQQLLMYLESKMKRQGVSSATTQRRPPPSAPVRNPAAPTGTGELLKKESEDQKDWLYQDRRKKKGAEKSHTKPQMSQPLGQDSSNSKQLKDAPSLNQPLKHDFHHLADFERVGVHAPMGTNAIPKTIEALKERLEHFRSFIRTLEELKAEDAAAAAATAATTTTAVAEMGSATAMSEVDTKTSTEDKE